MEINLVDPTKPMTRYHDKELGGEYQSCVIELIEAD